MHFNEHLLSYLIEVAKHIKNKYFVFESNVKTFPVGSVVTLLKNVHIPVL